MYERIKVEKYVIPMDCARCSHTWNYTGKNQHVVTCPLCRTKLSIKKNNRIMQTRLKNETPGQSANITDEGKSKEKRNGAATPPQQRAHLPCCKAG